MISVVIPTYRKPAQLRRTLAALLPQTRALAGDCEVIVVDDGSQDDTGAVLDEASAAGPLAVVRPPRNEGRARARNRGWRAARGESVLFLDDDIVLDAGALAAHVQAQRARPAAYLGEVATAPELIDSPLFAYLDSRGIAKRPPGGAVPARYFLTQNASVPRAALERIGGFDEEFGAYGFEDMEVAFRLEDRAELSFYRLEGARGLHIHHHGLDEYLAKKRLCGQSSLPVLERLHPSRMAEMHLDVLPGVGAPKSASRRALRVLLSVSFTWGGPRLARTVAVRRPQWLAAPLRSRVYDYLVLAAYADGLRAARHAKLAAS